MDGKWQKQQDQRAIQSRDVNNGSYLVTWVTSCSSRQPLPNLWTSLVRTEPQQSPCVTLCTCCEHRASFADIFASRKVPGHWPCLPQAGAAFRQHRRAHRRWLFCTIEPSAPPTGPAVPVCYFNTQARRARGIIGGVRWYYTLVSWYRTKLVTYSGAIQLLDTF